MFDFFLRRIASDIPDILSLTPNDIAFKKLATEDYFKKNGYFQNRLGIPLLYPKYGIQTNEENNRLFDVSSSSDQ